MAQLKFVIEDRLLKKFKQIVLAKHGKIELTPEGEDAIRLYVKKYEHLLGELPSQEMDPLKRVVGIIRSKGARSALRDLKSLESGEL